MDEILTRLQRVVKRAAASGARRSRATWQTYGPFAATEPLLMALVKAGADRQEMHERIRERSMAAWAAVQRGEANPLADLLAADAAHHRLSGRRAGARHHGRGRRRGRRPGAQPRAGAARFARR